jgi:oligopeptide transport system substrate-binding protein
VAADGYTVEPGKGVLVGPENTIYYFAFNLKKAPFDNVNVRREISLAINRDAIAQQVFEGTYQPASSFITPGIPGYAANAWQYSRLDVAAAKKALAAAGYPGGKGLPPIKIICNSGQDHEKVVQFIVGDLKDNLGITATSESFEGGQYQALLGSGDFQMARFAWTADYPTPDNFTAPIFATTGMTNISAFSSPTVDAQIDKARALMNETERVQTYEQIQQTLGDAAPACPIVYYTHRKVGSNRIHDLFYDNMDIAHLERVWLTAGSGK